MIEEVHEPTGDESDEDVGVVELMAESEVSFPLFNQTIVDFALELERCGEIAKAKTVDMERAADSTKPLAARLIIVRELAQELSDPADRMESLAGDYLDQLSRVDGGIRSLVALARNVSDPEELEAARTFSGILRELAGTAAEGLGALDGFRSSLRTLSQMSSSLRPVMRRIDSAVAALLPSRKTFNQWSQDMEAAIAQAPANGGEAALESPGRSSPD